MGQGGGSFTEHYLKFFGDATGQVVEHLPYDESDFYDSRKHIELYQQLPAEIHDDKLCEVAEAPQYSHPCWCHPELIYADDVKGNEVWLHKRAQ